MSSFTPYSSDNLHGLFVANTITYEKKCPAYARIHVDSLRISGDSQSATLFVYSGNRLIAEYPCGEEFFQSGISMFVGGIGETIIIVVVDPGTGAAGADISFSGRIEYPEEQKRRFPSTSGRALPGAGVKPPNSEQVKNPKIERSASGIIEWFKKLRH